MHNRCLGGFHGKGVSCFGEGTGGGALLQSQSVGGGGDLQKEQQVASLLPDYLNGVRGPRGAVPELGPNWRSVWFPNKGPVQLPPLTAAHVKQGWGALGTGEVTDPGGQSGWPGGQHNPSRHSLTGLRGP